MGQYTHAQRYTQTHKDTHTHTKIHTDTHMYTDKDTKASGENESCQCLNRDRNMHALASRSQSSLAPACKPFGMDDRPEGHPPWSPYLVVSQRVDAPAFPLHLRGAVFVVQHETVAVPPVGEHFGRNLGFIGADPLWRMIKQDCSAGWREKRKREKKKPCISRAPEPQWAHASSERACVHVGTCPPLTPHRMLDWETLILSLGRSLARTPHSHALTAVEPACLSVMPKWACLLAFSWLSISSVTTSSLTLTIFHTWSLRGGSFSTAIFNSDIQLRVYSFSGFISCRVYRFVKGNVCQKFAHCFKCLIDIRKRSFLTSCVLWFAFLDASSHLCFQFLFLPVNQLLDAHFGCVADKITVCSVEPTYDKTIGIDI